jgi:hypothetical protein
LIRAEALDDQTILSLHHKYLLEHPAEFTISCDVDRSGDTR